MIRPFVSINRRMSGAFQKRFPSFFDLRPCIGYFGERVNEAIATENPKVILEVGGVDRPHLAKSPQYEYIGVDIDDRPECYGVYDRFIVQSVENQMPVSADMILSVTLLEHVPNNKAAVSSMYESLNGGGSTHHYIPSKWHPYAICLRLVGPHMQRILIRHLRPDSIHSGYPAFFDHCSAAAMERLFEKSGFRNIRVECFYYATDYFAFFFPAYVAMATFEKICKLLNLRVFASGFVISATKPNAL